MIPYTISQGAKTLINLEYRYPDSRINPDKGSSMNPDEIRVVIASSSNLFLEGIRRILQGERDIRTVAEASNPKDIEKHVTDLRPTLLFVDNRMLNLDIYDLLKLIERKSPNTRVILLGEQGEEQVDSPNITYITKETGSSELISIIRRKKADESSKKRSDDVKDRLTKTELKVIELIINGYSNKEIASKLSISEKTVKAHLTSIFMKLNLENRYQLIVYGTQLKRRAR